MLADRRYCYPLTLTDAASRYLLCCEALSSTQASLAFTVFERIFKDYGLPGAIRTDNGVPFASPNSLFNLSKLSVWWLRLGIQIERIQPSHPEQNGAIEFGEAARDALLQLPLSSLELMRREVLVPIVHRLELAAIDHYQRLTEQTDAAA